MEEFFKSDRHYDLFYKMMEKAGYKPSLHSDPEYMSFCYLLSASEKDSLLKFIGESGINRQGLLEDAAPYSSSERALIRAGLHLFNSNVEDISIFDAFYNLDAENGKVMLNGIKMRFSCIDSSLDEIRMVSDLK